MANILTVCHKVRVNSQGYAYGGQQYFGTGAPLYYAEFEDGRSGHVRASSRDEAIKAAIARPNYWGIC
jgi:hypothetical protein